MASQSVGWYPDPNDDRAEVYWDGSRWHGRRQKSTDESQPPVQPPRPPDVIDKLKDSWHGLARSGQIVLVIVVLLCVLSLIGVIYALQKSPYEDECKAQANEMNLKNTDFDGYVTVCIKNGEMMGHT